MGRWIGKPQGATSPQNLKAQGENLALGRRARQIRFRGRLASAEQVKAALSGNVGEYLAVLDDLAQGAEDDRVKLDAARYLIDRVAGKPTEKVQQEVSTKPAVMPSDEQLERLAQRVLREREDERAEEPESEPGRVDASDVH